MAKMVHVCIEVSDIDRAAAFYRDAFALQRVEQQEGVYAGRPFSLAYLRGDAESFELELVRYHDASLPPAPRRDNHFAVVVDDLEAAYATLAGFCQQIDPAITDHVVGGVLHGRYFFVHDPDGNAIEIMQRMGRYR
jgi:catechol 2,3-dioxygenase-like lactoylglutathione lyase family enzyme